MFLFEKAERAGKYFANHKKMYPATHLVLNDPALIKKKIDGF